MSNGYRLIPVPMTSSVADYYLMQFAGSDGAMLEARYIQPRGNQNVPLVLAFHDVSRSVRGWHHLTRYTALGYAVVALRCRAPICDIAAGIELEQPSFVQYYDDAVLLAHVASELEGVDGNNIMLCGDGMGGALAAAVAAALPEQVTKCAIFNPMPCAVRTVWGQGLDVGFYQGVRSYFRNNDPVHTEQAAFFAQMDKVDCLQFASKLRCRLLLGTAMLDKTAPPVSQQEFYDAVTCDKRQIKFPRHDHELINAYENEQLKFLLER